MHVRFCAPEIEKITLPQSICAGDCIRPDADVKNYPQQYHWYFPGASPESSVFPSPGLVCYDTPGTYTIRLVVENPGGSDEYITSLTVFAKPVPRFTDTAVTVTYKNIVQLPSCAGAQTVSWYKDGQLICSGCPSITIEGKQYLSAYVCVVRNGDCMDSCLYRLQVIDIPHDVWLPDAFTPNHDGLNDVFRIITDNPNVYAVNLYVFNRWGQQIYISHNDKDGWDGTVNGRALDAGTYFWTLRYKVLGTDEAFFKKGDIQLIR